VRGSTRGIFSFSRDRNVVGREGAADLEVLGLDPEDLGVVEVLVHVFRGRPVVLAAVPEDERPVAHIAGLGERLRVVLGVLLVELPPWQLRLLCRQ
jgi:hypothetical protein